MNPATDVNQSSDETHSFSLALLGFSEAEKAMFASTFRLTGKRKFSYVETEPENRRVDVYLVNGDNAEALRNLQAYAPNVLSPALILGRNPVEAGWPFIQMPIRWRVLFEQLDELMQSALIVRSRKDPSVEESREAPVRQLANDNRREPASSAAPPVAAPPPSAYVPPPIPSEPKDSVLVVDDSATVRAFMRIKLAPFNFDVDYAESGEQAIDMAQLKKYTCIFLDVMMPGIDGYEVCKRIKSNPDFKKKTAVVMLSSKSSMFDKFRGNWAGCDAYLGKPVAEDDLLTTIARFLPSARA